MVKKNCKRCSIEFEIPEPDPANSIFAVPSEWFIHCDECADFLQKEAETKAKLAAAGRGAMEKEAQWEIICPKGYRNTNLAQINQVCAKLVMTWDVSSSIGLGITGDSRIGKTRAMFVALRRAFDAHGYCDAISHVKFSKMVIDIYSPDADALAKAEAKKRLSRLQTIRCLLLDDLGKAPSTDRVDSELEDLIETRVSECRPILWTSNGSSSWLAGRFGDDRGVPIVSRLGEFCTVENIRTKPGGPPYGGI